MVVVVSKTQVIELTTSLQLMSIAEKLGVVSNYKLLAWFPPSEAHNWAVIDLDEHVTKKMVRLCI